MVVSLTRMLKSFGQAQDDLSTLAAKNAQEMAISQDIEVADNILCKSLVPTLSLKP